MDFRFMVNDIYVVGYSISMVALFVSLALFFFFYRTLGCTRVRIHMHLFSSFALNNICWVVWYKTVVNSTSVLQDNKIWCQLLHLITTYFMLTNYLWMFCEGLHLHTSLVVVFVRDDVGMRKFIALGWGLSVIIVFVYAVARYLTGSIERCWSDESYTFYILVAPVCICLMASIFFLINVMRVLLTKQQLTQNQNVRNSKKAVRAALLLIPLFGLHYVLIPLLPGSNSPGENIYQVVSAIITSLQGICLTILYCFTNHDVTTAVRSYFVRLKLTADAIPMTGLTGAGSVVNTRENVV